MTQLSYLLRAEVRNGRAELNGKVLTRPALLVTDGQAIVYACDVDIGVKDPAGNDQTNDLIDKYNTILRNVPVARSDFELIYADVGAAVRLRRGESGQYQIVGFSDEMPGTYTRVAVSLGDASIGAIEDYTLEARPLTLGELADYGGFGSVPFGAIGVFQGGVLIRIQT